MALFVFLSMYCLYLPLFSAVRHRLIIYRIMFFVLHRLLYSSPVNPHLVLEQSGSDYRGVRRFASAIPLVPLTRS
ncbi:hypothetical protein EDD16DRAFT_1618836 [Pisolithus croceorrhizus]|nr:hypothetical protein EDD16DRAFT_1618836 [Pisolithus croceorrhizus]